MPRTVPYPPREPKGQQSKLLMRHLKLQQGPRNAKPRMPTQELTFYATLANTITLSTFHVTNALHVKSLGILQPLAVSYQGQRGILNISFEHVSIAAIQTTCDLNAPNSLMQIKGDVDKLSTPASRKE